MTKDDGANAQTAPVNTEVAGNDELQTQEQTTDINARLLRESKEWKAKYQQLRHEREDTEKRRLESQQEWKALAEKLTTENKSLEESYKREKIRAAVHDRALRAGCLNVEDLLVVGNTGLLQVDDQTHEVQGADLFVEEARRLKPYLFQQKSQGKSSTINSVTPGGVPEKKISSTDVASMKQGDPRKMNAWVEAMRVKPQN